MTTFLVLLSLSLTLIQVSSHVNAVPMVHGTLLPTRGRVACLLVELTILGRSIRLQLEHIAATCTNELVLSLSHGTHAAAQLLQHHLT